MGSPRDVMMVFAERDIRQVFSEQDGWKITQLNGPAPAERLFRVSRYNKGGYETAFVEVSFDKAPNKESVRNLDAMPNGHGSRTAKYLLTPQKTEYSGIPASIRVLPMTAFGFAEGNLVWLTKKKNARKYFSKETAAT